MIRNIRDLSMYKNKDGKHLIPHKFYRSAALVNLKEKDRAFLNTFASLKVIDLRTASEKEEKPDEVKGQYFEFSLLSEELAGISHDESSEKQLSSIPDMVDLYQKLIDDPHTKEMIKNALMEICNTGEEETVLWHCSEGKDRCGLISMLFLSMMNFDRYTIMQDYLKSQRSSGKKAHYYYFMIRFFKKDPVQARAVRNAYSVKKEYLVAALGVIRRKYGSVDGYFDALGLDQEFRENARARYLV